MTDLKGFEIYEYEPYRGGYKILGFNETVDLDERFGIYIPEGTTAIDESAFAYDNITSVNFPASLLEICDDAFSGCEYLTEIHFAEGCKLHYIGDSAFSDTPLKRVTLPPTVRQISDDAFAKCRNLISINFGDLSSLLRIGDSAFSECTSLETAALPHGLKELCYNAFENCSSLNFVGIPATVRTMEFEIFPGCHSLSQINIDLDKIPEYWDEDFLDGCNATVNMRDCAGYTPISKLRLAPYPYGENKFTVLGPVEWGITELNLHPDIVNIAREAFKEQLYLKSFRANAPYIVIGGSAFESSGLKSIDFEDGYICEKAFCWTAVERAILTKGFDFSTYQHSAVKALTLAEGFDNGASILPYTFSHTRFTEFRVPDEFSYIGHHAFCDCVNLERLDLNAVTSISESAFESCGSLKEITFPKNDCLIWERAFKNCYNLEKVEIQDGNGISQEMFYGCTALTEVTVRGKRTRFYDDSFTACKIRKFILKDTYSYEFDNSCINKVLETLFAERGDKVTFIFKDKNIVRTKRYKNYWD